MNQILFFDRLTGEIAEEKVYGDFFLKKLYQTRVGRWLLPLIAGNGVFSKLYGWIQKTRWSQKKIRPFIQKFHINEGEFADSVKSFKSFNDFFTRKLKIDARPLDQSAVLPADGRYRVYPQLGESEGIWVKGKYFDLEKLLDSKVLAKRYKSGAVMIARLCPVDYHRFHFPFDCKAGDFRLINGPLYSVSPIALKYNIDILHENKRVITQLESDEFGSVQFIEIGATNVGSIVQTYQAGLEQKKGDEKGYFEFGGSCIIMLFEPGRIHFADDLIHYSSQNLEVRGFMGQALGKSDMFQSDVL